MSKKHNTKNRASGHVRNGARGKQDRQERAWKRGATLPAKPPIWWSAR